MFKRKKKDALMVVKHQTPTPSDYYLWNPFKKLGFNIYRGIKDKFMNMTFPRVQLIVLTTLVVLIGGLVLFIRLNMIVVGLRDDFDVTNFTQAEDLAGETVEISNNRFTLSFDETTTQFALYDNVTNHAWHSNITTFDDYPGITQSSRNAQQDTLVVRYVDDSGVERSIQNYTEAIVRNQYYVSYPDEKTIEVYYEIGNTDVDYTDLPQRLSKERFETLILEEIDAEEYPIDYRFIENAYTFVTEQQVYSLNNAASFSQNAINRLHNIIFNMTPYTYEDMREDHLEQGVELADTKPMIKVAIRYTLTEQGFNATIINESIGETEDYPLANIDVLPNFGEASLDNEGYLFVPEGSGALIDLNNGKSTREYNQRLYGPDDAKVPMSRPNESETTALPVFGMKKDDQAFIGIITEGASMASLHARVSEQRDSYNRVYTRFHYKESDRIRIPGVSSGEQSQLFRTVWTRYYSEADYQIAYHFTDNDSADYMGMAALFRDYLEQAGLQPRQTAEGIHMNVTLLGGYEKRNYFLGVPYDTIEPLTTTQEAQSIMEALLEENVQNLNMVYSGWMNGGIEHYLPSDIDFHRAIGSQKDFEALMDFGNAQNIMIYPEVNFVRPYSNENLNTSSDTARTIAGDLAVHYKYNLATDLPDRSTKAEYIINPAIIDDVMADFFDSYQDLPFTTLAIDDLANRLSGSYNNQEFYFRHHSEALQKAALDDVRSHTDSVLLRNPLGYAIPYGDLILDLPVRGTEFNIIDRSVPFYQLALSGLIDYAGKPFNLFDERSMEWHKLKALESGSHLNFTWTYQDTYDLMHTEYNYLYSTQYENWFDIAVGMYHELSDVDVHGARLIYHEHIARDVVAVEYDNGTTIVINYRNNPYIYQGLTIPPMDYRYTQGGE